MDKIALASQLIVAFSVLFVWVFRFDNIVKEFKQYGLSDLIRNSVGASKISLSALLIAGVFYPGLVVFSSLSMAFFMFCAQLAHIKVRNPLIKFIPSLLFLVLSLFIAAVNMGLLQLMTLTIILSFFSGISFLFYGISSFRSRRMKAEFERWGFLNHRFTIGTFQILGGLGLLLGLLIPYLLLISSLALTLMMLVAILVRIRIKDELLKIIPAFFYMMINGIIFYLVIMNDFL